MILYALILGICLVGTIYFSKSASLAVHGGAYAGAALRIIVAICFATLFVYELVYVLSLTNLAGLMSLMKPGVSI